MIQDGQVFKKVCDLERKINKLAKRHRDKQVKYM